MSRRRRDVTGELAQRVAEADVVVVGPAPPLRGGIAAHGAGLADALRADGLLAGIVSYRRLYPSLLFPGRSQRTAASVHEAAVELLDVLSPRSWAEAGALLRRSRATVVLQWWHPVVAPALLGATRGVDPARIVAVVHNLLPHERLPGARVAAGRVLARAGCILCHGRREADAVRALAGERADVRTVALPCLLPAALVGSLGSRPPEAGDEALRWVVAAGHVRPYKGIDVLLEAWLAARRPPEARLAIVGEWYLRGAGRRRVERLARLDSSITVVDRYVDDPELMQWLSTADVLVAAHRRASQSGVVPVAAAIGRRCIVSDAGELAVQAGAGAEVVRAGDAVDLARAIERALAAPRVPAPRAEHVPARIAADWRRVIEAILPGGRPSGVRSTGDGGRARGQQRPARI